MFMCIGLWYTWSELLCLCLWGPISESQAVKFSFICLKLDNLLAQVVSKGQCIYWEDYLLMVIFMHSVFLSFISYPPVRTPSHANTPIHSLPCPPPSSPWTLQSYLPLFYLICVCVCACERSYFHISVNFVSVTVTKTLQVLLCNPDHPFTEPKKLAAILRLGCLFPLPNVKKIVRFIVRHKS